jgi:hypothetical protein
VALRARRSDSGDGEVDAFRRWPTFASPFHIAVLVVAIRNPQRGSIYSKSCRAPSVTVRSITPENTTRREGGS